MNVYELAGSDETHRSHVIGAQAEPKTHAEEQEDEQDANTTLVSEWFASWCLQRVGKAETSRLKFQF